MTVNFTDPTASFPHLFACDYISIQNVQGQISFRQQHVCNFAYADKRLLTEHFLST